MNLQVIDTPPRDITPEELARIWWDMASYEQADFFNSLGALASRSLLAKQLEFIRNEFLSGDAREVMRLIGEYSEKEA